MDCQPDNPYNPIVHEGVVSVFHSDRWLVIKKESTSISYNMDNSKIKRVYEFEEEESA